MIFKLKITSPNLYLNFRANIQSIVLYLFTTN